MTAMPFRLRLLATNQLLSLYVSLWSVKKRTDYNCRQNEDGCLFEAGVLQFRQALGNGTISLTSFARNGSWLREGRLLVCIRYADST